MFEFNYQLFELSGDTPVHESPQFIPCVKAFVQEDIEKARRNYYKRNTFYKLWVPPLSSATKYAKDYLNQK